MMLQKYFAPVNDFNTLTFIYEVRKFWEVWSICINF